jgi:hypothetical protein
MPGKLRTKKTWPERLPANLHYPFWSFRPPNAVIMDTDTINSTVTNLRMVPSMILHGTGPGQGFPGVSRKIPRVVKKITGNLPH